MRQWWMTIVVGCSCFGLGLLGSVIAGKKASQSSTTKVSIKQGGAVLASQVPVHVIAKGKASVKILLDKHSVGAKNAYMGILTALPGTKVPVHVHKDSAELIYVLDGQGMMTLGKKAFRVKTGMAVYIPPNTPHSVYVDTKVQPLKVLQVYAKAGPEQRFRRGVKVME